MQINSYILKIAGSVEIPKELTSGHNYKVIIEGAIPKMETSDNENGTFDVTYKMKPIRVEVVTETGETIKAKDPRRNSELARSQARAIHMEKGLAIDPDKFYDLLSARIRHLTPMIAEELIKLNNLE